MIYFIKIAPNREWVLHSLRNEDYLRPIQIAEKKTDFHPNAVSKNLKDLRKHDLVYVINPDYHVPMLYMLTSKGKRILKVIDEDE